MEFYHILAGVGLVIAFLFPVTAHLLVDRGPELNAKFGMGAVKIRPSDLPHENHVSQRFTVTFLPPSRDSARVCAGDLSDHLVMPCYAQTFLVGYSMLRPIRLIAPRHVIQHREASNSRSVNSKPKTFEDLDFESFWVANFQVTFQTN